MSDRKNKQYRELINSTRWRKLRNAYITSHPLCERCASEGRVTAAEEVHHIAPIEFYHRDLAMMREKCFDPANLMSVCRTCHGKLHKELGSRTHEAMAERGREKAKRFIMKFLQ